jgi:hypothetical protein
MSGLPSLFPMSSTVYPRLRAESPIVAPPLAYPRPHPRLQLTGCSFCTRNLLRRMDFRMALAPSSNAQLQRRTLIQQVLALRRLSERALRLLLVRPCAPLALLVTGRQYLTHPVRFSCRPFVAPMVRRRKRGSCSSCERAGLCYKP